MQNIFLTILLCIPVFLCANEIPHRIATAQRTTSTMRIDGSLDEEAWVNATIADKFTTSSPRPGLPAEFETQVRILYNDDAIYIGALMIDPEPEKIMKQLAARDGWSNSSSFSIAIDAYQSGINGFGFEVSAAGVQTDYALSPEGEDDNWDAVWDSKVTITEYGWIAEIEIPYSALRFPKAEVQKWGLNFGRQTRRNREQSYWNEVDPMIEGFLSQAGVLQGVENIKTPVRLMVTPYLSYGGNTNLKQSGSTSSAISGGMDLKYGLTDAFTLDMTLIPDFSQARFDEEILNLTPFEVQFDENRGFFTEGTELFQKAGLFYSRRIGGAPLHRGRVSKLADEGNKITRYNNVSQLVNATKLSGRMQSGLGIGVFNAIVAESNAIYETPDGRTESVQVNPMTNYNVFVADQNLPNNSFISLINTNVSRAGEDYEANVTGTEFTFRTKDQKYMVGGSSAVSQKYYTDETDLGYKYNITAGKVSGRLTYYAEYSEDSPTYDINDLGFLTNANQRELRIGGALNNYDPKTSWINRSSIRVRSDYSRLVDPNVFTDFSITANGFVRTNNFIGTGGFVRLEPIQTFDYFEPRTQDFSQYYTFPTNFMFGAFMSTNYNNPVAINLDFDYRVFNEAHRNSLGFEIGPRWRVSDMLNMNWNYDWRISHNDVGYVSNNVQIAGVEDPVIFGKRDRKTVVNELTTRLIFNENMFITLVGRHYWSKVIYNSYHLLGSEGELIETPFSDKASDGGKAYDVNFNLLNMDLVYNWRFAPGSDLVFVLKNFANNGSGVRDLRDSYSQSVQSVYEYNNNFSMNLKVLYFLDYHRVVSQVSKQQL